VKIFLRDLFGKVLHFLKAIICSNKKILLPLLTIKGQERSIFKTREQLITEEEYTGITVNHLIICG
jgi:hypothetical protein